MTVERMTAEPKTANVRLAEIAITAGSPEDTCMRGAIAPTPTCRPLWSCLLVAWLLWPQALVAGLPEGIAGRWSGVVEAATGEATVRAILQPRGDGFEVDIGLPEGPPLRARFLPTDEPHVFQIATSRRGLFGFFDGSDRSSPFDGEPLIWARSSVVGIVAYRLSIAADGGMTLLRIAFEPVDTRLQMSVEQRIDADPRSRFDVLLEPTG